MKSKKTVLSLLLAAVLVTAGFQEKVCLAETAGKAVVLAGKKEDLRMKIYRKVAEEEKDWILSCQLDNGLILYRQWKYEQDSQMVIPYFSSIAAMGLLSGTVTEVEAKGARNYILWYLDHLNTEEEDPVNGDGTVYNYQVTCDASGYQVKSAEEYDSVDSYAALFLILAGRYGEKIGTHMLKERSEDICRVAEVLLRTIGENGLSCTKAEYPVQYTMDNAEVYAGLKSGAELLEQISPEYPQIDKLRQTAETLREAAERDLWNASGSFYEIGLYEEKPFGEVSWSEFYPDGVGQLFPGCFGLTEENGTRAQELYERFCDTWSWEHLEHRKDEDSFYWCILAYCSARMGDESRVKTFLETYRESIGTAGRGYPLYTGDAGWLALACGEILQQNTEK